VSVVSAGCVLWLDRLQPLFAAVAISALVYQGWLVWRRPPHPRTRLMKVILWVSGATTLTIGVGLVVLWLRYR
jgi:uncharacterized membrane protein SirB2